MVSQSPKRNKKEFFMKKFKRILALLGAALLLGLYALTLITALMDSPQAGNWFKASLACTIVVPIFLYACILVYRWVKK